VKRALPGEIRQRIGRHPVDVASIRRQARPWSLGSDHHARRRIIGHHGAQTAPTARIFDMDDIAVTNTARDCIGGIDLDEWHPLFCAQTRLIGKTRRDVVVRCAGDQHQKRRISIRRMPVGSRVKLSRRHILRQRVETVGAHRFAAQFDLTGWSWEVSISEGNLMFRRKMQRYCSFRLESFQRDAFEKRVASAGSIEDAADRFFGIFVEPGFGISHRARQQPHDVPVALAFAGRRNRRVIVLEVAMPIRLVQIDMLQLRRCGQDDYRHSAPYRS
jgi:hypothetical protein